jgi:phosphoadenosine phosphosulfate reductase
VIAPSDAADDPDESDLDGAASAFEGAPPERSLAWATRRWPGRVVLATGFGAEGCVLVDLVGRLGLPVRVFTLDTDYLFPETLDLWRRLEERYGLVIEAVRPAPVADQANVLNGGPLHATDPDRCCFLRKVEPLQRFLSEQSAWATAIRRDQSLDRRNARVVERDVRFGLVKLNPLAGWSHGDVWEQVRRFDVPTNPLHERGYVSIGCAPCTSPVAEGEDPRAGRWRDREKTECGLHASTGGTALPFGSREGGLL